MKPQLLVLALGTFAIGTDGFVVAGVIPSIARDVLSTVAESGLLVSGFALTYGLSAPILTTALARLPRHAVLVGSMVGLAAANVTAAVASAYGLLFAARVAAALAAAAYSPLALATAVQISPSEHRGRAVSTVLAGMTLSLVIGVPLGSLLGSAGSWRWTFVLVAFLAAAAAAGIKISTPHIVPMPATSLRARLLLLRRPAVTANLAAPFLWLTGTFTLYTYIVVVLQRSTGWHGNTISLLLLLYGAAAFVGNASGGVAADRWGGKRCVMAALGCTTAAFVAIGAATDAAGTTGRIASLAGLVLWGVAGWSLTPSQSHRLLAAAPTAGAEVLSLNTSAIYLGIASGSALGSRLLAHADVSVLGYVAAGMQISALMVVALTPVQKPPSPLIPSTPLTPTSHQPLGDRT